MPSCARSKLIRNGEFGLFHVWARCVRRAWLFGVDPLTGNDYSHRRDWIVERLKLLVQCFAIDVGFAAVLSNHYHLVIRVNPRLIERLSDREVARRWLRVYPGTRVLDGNWIEPTDERIDELLKDKKYIQRIRRRLAKVSWFMASLNQYIAHRANRADNVRGAFWSSRYGSRECTDESSLLIAGLYVDLNQIRAGEAETPEQALNSTIGWRLMADRLGSAFGNGSTAPHPSIDLSWLAPLTLGNEDLLYRTVAVPQAQMPQM